MSTACIMFGVRKTVGATIIPLTAPSAAANPQPSASSHDVRTPSSRAAAGLSAPARIASPSFVNRKNAASTSTHAIVTANVPTSCLEMWTPPITHDDVGNGLGKNFSSGDQIQAASPFRMTRSAIVAMTTVITNAQPHENPWCAFSDQAMYVVNIAISPCAKLITSVAL